MGTERKNEERWVQTLDSRGSVHGNDPLRCVDKELVGYIMVGTITFYHPTQHGVLASSQQTPFTDPFSGGQVVNIGRVKEPSYTS